MNCPTSTLHKPLIRMALASGLLALLAACGGGGSISEPNNDATISGSLVKGPVAAGKVCAYSIADGVQAEQRACSATDDQGRYTIRLQSVNPAGETLVVAATRMTGRYIDEATGTQRPLDATLRSAVRVLPGDEATVMVTPLTELAMRRAETSPARLHQDSIDQAMAMVATAFDVADLRQTRPADPTQSSSMQAARGERNYGLALAAVSSLQANLPVAAGGSVTLEHALEELAQSFAPDRVTAQDLKFKAALQSFLSGPRNASGVSPAAMSAAVSLQMDVLPLAFGVLPAVQALGPQTVTTPPTVPNDGPACRVTVSQPAVGGQYYFPMTPHNFCVRKVQAQQCEVTTMQGLLRGDKLYNALQGPAFGMTDHAVQPVDTCTTGADSTIDLG
jgi:hypothetical protein